MNGQATVFAVGTDTEIAHHVAPLKSRLNLTIAPPQEVLVQARPGDLAIFYSEHFDRFRDACRQLRDRQVATLYLIDGILEWRNAWETASDELACPWTMRPALADKIACLGFSQARLLAAWGNAEKIEVVGAPRFDRLLHPPRPSPAPNGSSTWRVMVATAKCPGFTPQQVETTLRGLTDVKRWLDDHPTFRGKTVEVIWRLTGSFAERLGVQNQCSKLDGAELAGQLAQCHALITTPSTLMLEGMAVNCPVALLDYHNTPQYAAAAWTIAAAEHLPLVIGELMDPPQAKRAHQRWLFRDHLYQGQAATDRLVELISAMLAVSQSCLAEGKPLRFPPQLLGTGLPIEETWDFAAVYPEYADFHRFDAAELQRELAHARREIQRLNSRIDQLQSELGEAHRIFESIQRHPVAGPIVRLRQRWLDWVASMSTLRDAATEPPTDVRS